MADQALRFYLDEQMPVVIAAELKRRGIDTITVNELGLRGDADVNHLQRATEMGRVLCTMDDDFLELAKVAKEHAGIVIGTRKDLKAIGTWVKFLEMMHKSYTSDLMRNQVEYLKLV